MTSPLRSSPATTELVCFPPPAPASCPTSVSLMPWPPPRILKQPLRQVTVSRPNASSKPQQPPGTFSLGNTRLRLSPASTALTNHRALHRRTKRDSPSSLNRLPKQLLTMTSIKGNPDPAPLRSSSPPPLSKDFARQVVSKQQRSNFHSSSISIGVANKMVTQSVNKTALHPTGVQ